jgi:hypothetical protein
MIKDTAKHDTKGDDSATCCVSQAKCSTIKCPVGMKQVANHADKYCAGTACVASCTGTGCKHDSGTCCENDAAKCKYGSHNCGATKYKDPAKFDGPNDATCCEARAECSTLKCSDGKKTEDPRRQHQTVLCGK